MNQNTNVTSTEPAFSLFLRLGDRIGWVGLGQMPTQLLSSTGLWKKLG